MSEFPPIESPIAWGDEVILDHYAKEKEPKPPVDMVLLEEAYFQELKRRLDDEPEKIPGSILPRLTDFFTEQREKRQVAEERQAALDAQAKEDPLAIILMPGIPLFRKQFVLMEHCRALREELDEAEKALGGLGSDAA